MKPPSTPQALFISNRRCRSCRTESRACAGYFEEQGLSVIECRTEEPHEILDCVTRYGPQIDRVIVGGGDGTLNLASEAILRSGLPMGIIPLGTANDLARTLGIPSDPEAACRVIVEGKVKRIDLGSVNGRYFFNVAHIGLGARVTGHLTGEAKRYWGPFGYAKSLVTAYMESRPFYARITSDGRAETFNAVEIAVGNGRHFGGFMTISEDAEIDDHVLNLFLLKPQSVWRLAYLASVMRKGRLKNIRRIKSMTGQRMEVKTTRSMPVVADGEFVARTPAVFLVHHKVLSVFVPPPPPDFPQ